MYYGKIATDNSLLRDECKRVIVEQGGIDVEYLSDISLLNPAPQNFNLLFIIFSEINPDVLKKFGILQKRIPNLALILYNHSLTLPNLNELNGFPVIKLVVGENRKTLLKEELSTLKKNYWRNIPFGKFQISYDQLSPRIKKALKFIESADISKCNMNTIANYLQISPGYFSQQFKLETGQSFRSFMQKILNYYENIILSKLNISTTDISNILGYSELSSFSRSFKKRKGISPTKYKKMVKI